MDAIYKKTKNLKKKIQNVLRLKMKVRYKYASSFKLFAQPFMYTSVEHV